MILNLFILWLDFEPVDARRERKAIDSTNEIALMKVIDEKKREK